ncbi:MAG TPA: hypothetical protein DIV79_09160 [Opitutae bacterium]|nr:hypothetical protein [Opitutaceae bacterium]HCR30170.1 hypothetical protein [Opitutae bacterium]
MAKEAAVNGEKVLSPDLIHRVLAKGRNSVSHLVLVVAAAFLIPHWLLRQNFSIQRKLFPYGSKLQSSR